jgi:phosphoglycolate phosphatase
MAELASVAASWLGRRDKLVIFDADGTLVDTFQAVEVAFSRHDMDIGDLERFQKRRKLLKYLGGLREFPKNLRRQLDKQNRKQLIQTLTDVFRGEARLYPGMASLLRQLIETPDVRVGIVTRNITQEPEETLRQLLRRHDVDLDVLDFVSCISLKEEKLAQFRKIRSRFAINPARAYACGDEYRDYLAAIGAGMIPFVAAYGFEDHDRLRDGFNVPAEVIARTPQDLATRLCDVLNLDYSAGVPVSEISG